MPGRFDLQDLACFVRVVDLGGISVAARSLGLSKQTVSRRLQTLEADLGVRLLERSPRAVRATSVGQQLYRSALEVVAAADQLADVVQDVTRTPAGVLRIASPPFLATRFLAPAVESFLAAYPEVCVHLEVGLDHDRLVESNLDLAFRIGPLADSATVARAVGRARIVGVGTPERVAAIAARHPDDLRGLPFLCYGIAPHRTTWAHYVFERGDERRTIEVRGLLQVNRHEIVHAACRAGVALAVLPWVLVQSDVEAGALVRVLPEWRIPLVDLYVLRPSRPAKSPAVDAFLEHIEPLLRAAPWSAQPRPA